MQAFSCPQCGHESEFDPWKESAHCPQCGFRPPTGAAALGYVQWARRYAYQPLLQELQGYWHGRHQPEPQFTFESRWDAVWFFRDYRLALGEDPHGQPGPHSSYVRDYEPTEREILIFAGAYMRLRRGERAAAASELQALTHTAPDFVDPWVWLTATTDDVVERARYLEKAARLDAAHPLARDALVVARGQVATARPLAQDEIVTAHCFKCGGAWEYRPGAGAIACPYCGLEMQLERENVVDGAAGALHTLRLKRQAQRRAWRDVQRIVRCRTCGAEMSLAHHLARVCAFCGSANVLAADSQRELEQPDGFLPFEVHEAGARAAIEEMMIGRWRRLASWWNGRSDSIQGLQGVYLPFWVFDGIVEGYRFTKRWIRDEKETIGWQTYENLFLPGFDVPPVDLVERVYPFGVESMVPYEPGLLANWPAELYSRDVELAAEEAHATLIDRARKEAERKARAASGSRGGLQFSVDSRVGLDAASRLSTAPSAFQVIGVTYQLVLLPVWVAHVGDAGTTCLALVNGQTGRAAMGPREAAQQEG
ncbi:MAG: hypothetical protein JXA93_21630 [Anaerolineae bacterium]|nr:hypothetical protein [Anaerolineae bacterium]